MSADMRLSIEVHIDGRCDGVVDVGYGCQLRADDPADYLDHNWGQRGAIEVDALVMKFGGVGSVAMSVARLRYFAAVLASSLQNLGSLSGSGSPWIGSEP
jgi:hypothetical protein